jgi:hypothetical protein
MNKKFVYQVGNNEKLQLTLLTLKVKHYIRNFSSLVTGNTVCFHYTEQLTNAAYRNNGFVMGESRGTYGYVVRKNAEFFFVFHILLTMHLSKTFVNNLLDAQLSFVYVYVYSLHVSGSHVPINRRINCINTTFGIFHSV